MSTTEYSGYAFVNEEGVYKPYRGGEEIPDEHWVFSFFWTEPDHGFVRANQVVLHVDRNPIFSMDYAKKIFAKATSSLPINERKGLERMLASSQRAAAFSQRDLG